MSRRTPAERSIAALAIGLRQSVGGTLENKPSPQEIEEALTGSCECGYGGSCGCQSKYRKILAAAFRTALIRLEQAEKIAGACGMWDEKMKCHGAEKAEAALAAKEREITSCVEQIQEWEARHEAKDAELAAVKKERDDIKTDCDRMHALATNLHEQLAKRDGIIYIAPAPAQGNYEPSCPLQPCPEHTVCPQVWVETAARAKETRP